MLSIPDDPPASRLIAVLQMGKVASWTVVKTIQAAKADICLCTLKDARNHADAIVHLHDPRVFKRYLHDHRTVGGKIFVVSMVRDPLRNAIAAWFQNILNEDHPYYHFGSMYEVSKASGEDLVRFFRMYVADESIERFEAYSRQYGSALGIDAYDLRYDTSGVARGSFQFGEYIVIRVHCLPSALPQLSDMLALPLTECRDANVAAEKWYAGAYTRFLDAFRPTEDEIEAFYRSRFARCNFSPADLAQFIGKWSVSPGA